MFEAALHEKTAPFCEGPIGSGKDKGKKHPKRKTAQVRFISACMLGHLQDFPWWEWVFQSATPETRGRLRMNTSGSASLAGVRIVCEEDSDEVRVIKSRTLAGAFEFEPGMESALSKLEVLCRGDNPALGIPSSIHPSPGCGKVLYPLLRGGSNVYFSHVVSAIYLPLSDSTVSEEILEILEDPTVWTFLKMCSQATQDKKVNIQFAQIALQN